MKPQGNDLTIQQLQEEKRFKETLLEISEAATQVRDREGLFDVAMKKIKPLVKFNDAVLVLLSNEGQKYTHVHVAGNSPANEHANYPRLMNTTYPVKHSPIEDVIAAEKVGFFEVADWLVNYPDHPGVLMMRDIGEGYTISLLLLEGDYVYATLLFHYFERPAFNDQVKRLYSHIADQLAVAVSNVLAREQLLEEKQFKETLLEISEAATNIRNREDLYEAAMEKIKPIVKFDDAVCIVLSDDRNSYTHLLTMANKERQEHPRYREIVHQSLPLKNSPMEDIFGAEDFQQYHLTEWQKKYPNHPGLILMRDTGLKDSVVLKLKNSGQVFGVLVFHYEQVQQFTEAQRKLFPNIADQISVAVSNVLANEQLLEEKQFKETLLGISESVAKIQNRKELFRVIFEHIRPHIRIDDFGLVIFNDARSQWKNLAITHDYDYEHTRSAQLYRERGYDDWMPMDSLIKRISIGTGIITAEQCAEHKDFPINEIIQATGFKEFIYTPLQAGGSHFGILVLDSKSKGAYSEKDFPICLAIADQLAVAVSNVLANEQLLEEKRFKETLLEITESIANINTGKDLVSAIFDKLQKVFPFDDAGLFAFDWEKSMERDLMVDYEYGTTGVNTKINRAGITGWMPLTDLSQYLADQGITIADTKTMYTRFQHPHFEIDEMEPFQQVIFGPLKQGEEVIGSLYFWSNESNRFTQEDILIFQSMASQLSVALMNVLTNEQLLEEKQKTEDLLKVTEAIANINTAPGLVHAIFNKLQKAFPFDDVGLFHLDFENQQERHLVIDYADDTPGAPVLIQEVGLGSWLPIHELSKYVAKKGPLIMSPSELYERFDAPHFKPARELSFKQVIAGPLKKGRKTIGLLYFWSTAEDGFNDRIALFRSTCDQLSVALSNLLANEQIQQDNRQKQLLLEVSRAISSARTIDVLLKQVVQTLVPMFHSQEHALILIDEKNDEYKDLAVLYHDVAGSEIDTKYHEMGFYTTRKIPYQGSQLEAVIKACEKNDGNPLRFSYDEDYSGFTDRVLLEQLKEDMSEAVVVPLKAAGETFGVFSLAYTKGNHFDISQLPLFRSVSNQLATAVSNVLANEDIYRREKEKVLQVDLVNTLNREAPWHVKLEKASILLNDHLDGDLVIFAIQPDGHSEYCHTFERIVAGEYRHFNYHTLLDFVGVGEKEYQQTREMSLETILVSGKILEKYAKKDHLLAGIVKQFRIQSWLSIALQLGLPGRYRVSFLSRKNDAYGPQDKDFLLRLRPVMQLTIEKLLAYERIVHLSTQLKQEKDYLQEEVNITYDFANMIGQTQVMRQVFTQVSQVAKSDTTVFVLGETGTGKELIARALHDASPRRSKPLVKLNCAAMPESLIESELFGHERGAFTGALKKRVGKFELAHKGTIFLDEIGELPLAMQAKLLRVIQEKEFEPLGSNQTIRSDFRLIVATNRNLVEEVQNGTFRMDLFYRLNAFPILLPPLRQRAEDIPLLINHYGNLYAKKLGYQYHGIASSSLQKLQAYHWPGNIRELQNLVEQGLLVHGNKKLVLSPQTGNSTYGLAGTQTTSANLVINEDELEDITLQDIDAKKRELEKAYLEAVLQKTKWRISGRHGAAALLDAKAPTLESRLKKLGITRK